MCFRIVPNGAKWPMLPNPTKSYQMVIDGTQILSDGTQWYQMVRNDTKWYTMAPNGNQWNQMVLMEPGGTQ